MSDDPRLAHESIAGERPYQEDSVLVQALTDGRILVAVADGMGGHAAGEVASALALETLVKALEDGIGIDRAVELANREVHDKAKDPGKHGMGTTLTAALVEDGEYMIANVGDSRGYLLSDAGIKQITEDHSFVAEAMKRGQSEAEAMDTPYRDALTRSIGTSADVQVDVFGPFPVENDTALLLCSDGLYKTLDDGELQRIYVESGSPRGAAQALVHAALENGSDDNITVAIAEYGEVPRVQGHSTVTMEFDPEEAPADPGPVRLDDDGPDEATAAPADGGSDDAMGGGGAGEVATGAEAPAAAVPEPRLESTPATDGVPKAAIVAVAAVAIVLLLLSLLG